MQLKKNLADRFRWIVKLVEKLGRTLPPELSEIKLSPSQPVQKKRKRIHHGETQGNELPNVDGMLRNLNPPDGMSGVDGKVID